MSKAIHSRSLAAKLCYEVIDKGRSLDAALDGLPSDIEPRDRAFIQNLCFGVTRWYWQLKLAAEPLLNKPIRNKDKVIYFVLLQGIYQIKFLGIADHAAVSDSVECCDRLGKKWAKGMINACLRRFLRTKNEFRDDSIADFSHPEWMAKTLYAAWPEHAKTILAANNQQPPMCLRVNPAKSSRENYLTLLAQQELTANADPYSKYGIRLSSNTSVNNLPNFFNGWASVQDTASQLAANYLDLETNDRLLDACAAPGGKTAAILESGAIKGEMHALDIGGERNNKLKNTLERLQLTKRVHIISGDARQPKDWWDNKKYSKILLDAPCTGSGVIRRHPDIKHHRTGEDLDQLIVTQKAILEALWPLLEQGGRLLYTTCSVFPKENERQIKHFLSNHSNAETLHIDHPTGIKREYGVQTLPGISDMDGFFYCLLYKASE